MEGSVSDEIKYRAACDVISGPDAIDGDVGRMRKEHGDITVECNPAGYRYREQPGGTGG